MASTSAFSRLRDKLSALSTREKFLVVAVVGVTLSFGFDALVLVPQSERRAELVASQTRLEAQQLALNADLSSIGKRNGLLENAQAENAQLKIQSANLNAVLASMQGGAPKIGDLARSALKDFSRVTLVALKTLPVKTLIDAAPPKAIYKHGVELELRGNYLDLLAYLKNLEANSSQVFWSNAKVLTLTYPETSLRVTIFILSDQPILKIS